MVFKIFATLIAAITSLLGLSGLPGVPGLSESHQSTPTTSARPTATVDTTATSTAATSAATSTATPVSTSASAPVSTSVPTTAPVADMVEFGMQLVTELPANTHPGTEADMQKFITNRWVSPHSTDVKIDFSQSKLYKDYNKVDLMLDFGRQVYQKVQDDANVPENTRSYVGGTMCPKLRGLAWFTENRIHTIGWGKVYPVNGCGTVLQIEDTEFQDFFKDATLYFNDAGDRVYVKRHTDGAISEWKLHSL